MKRNPIDSSAPEAQATRTLDDHALCEVRGGVAVAYKPWPNVGESPYAYMERLGNYLRSLS